MLKLFSLFFLVPAFSFAVKLNTRVDIKPPQPKEVEHKLEKHGDVRLDEYFWLKDRKNPEVINYLKAENKYLDKIFEPTEDLQTTLFKEMRSRIKEDDSTYPLKDGMFYYYTRFEKDKQYPIYARKTSPGDKKEEVLFDVNQLAAKHEFYSARYEISPDHNMAALAYDTVGRRFYNIKFKDLKTGQFLKGEIKDVTDNMVWANDNQTLFYVKQDKEILRYYQVYRYNIRTAKSELVYEEKQDTYETFVTDSLTRKHIFINIASTLSNEVRIINADQPAKEAELLFAREKEHEFRVTEDDTYYYILSNKNAKNFRILRTPIEKPSLANADVWLAHRDETFIDNFMVFKEVVAVASRENGLTQIEVYNKADKKSQKLNFQDTAYSVELGDNAEYDTNEIRYIYYSLRSPSSVYDYDLTQQKSVLRKTKEVPNYDMSRSRQSPDQPHRDAPGRRGRRSPGDRPGRLSRRAGPPVSPSPCRGRPDRPVRAHSQESPAPTDPR